MKTRAWKAYWENSFAIIALVLLCSFLLPVITHAAPLPWSTKAPMPTPRSRIASGVVNGKIFVLGGAGSSAVEMYDPATDIWQPWTALTETVFAPCEVTKGDTIFMVSLNSSAVVAYNTNIHAYGPNPIPNPNPSGFTSVVGYLNTPRTGRAQATILNNKMYVVGTGPNMDTIEEFDLITHVSVTKQTRLPASRELPLVSAVGGKIYIMGGVSGGSVTNTCWEYDPATDSLTSKGPLPIAMAGNGAATWGGKIYIAGATTSGTFPPTSGDPTIRQYDPAIDSWTAFDGLPTWRYAAATQIVNGVLYVIGGDTGQAPDYNTPVNEAATLPLNSGSWLSRDPIQSPQNIVVHAGATTINDRIFVLGGRNMSGPGGLDTVYSYAPQSGMPWQVEPNLSVPVVGAPAVSYGPMIYLAGGEGTDIIQYYDTSTFPYTSGVAATMRYPRVQAGATVLNNKLYVVGGATAAIEEFDLTTNPITRTDRVDYLPDAIQQPGVVEANGKIYIMGGTPTAGPGSNYISDACIVYTPGGQAGPFAPCSPMPVAVNENQGAVFANGKIYLAGGAAYGVTYPGDTAALQAYDPLTDSWEVVDTMTSPRRDHSLANLNGRLFVMGGHNPVSMVEEWITAPAGSGGWTVQSVSPGHVDWLSTAHPPVPYGSYLKISGVYYYVTSSWAGPGYNTAQLQQCDQANGVPLTTTQWVCDESCYYATYPVPANVPATSVGQPIVQYATWSQVPQDNVPPATYLSLSGAPGANGTFASDVQMSLTASDNPGGSGVATTVYSYDGMNWGPYTAPVMISADGITTLYYRSSDNAGNQEATQQVTVNIVRPQGNWVVNSVYPLTGSGVDWLASQHSTVPSGSYLKISGMYYYVSSSNPGTWGDSSNTAYNTAWLFQCNQATGAILTTIQETCDEFGCTQTSFPLYASVPTSAQGQPIEFFLSFPPSTPGSTGTWSVDGFMATARMNHTATLLPSGYVLVAGGFSSFDNTPANAEMLYDPTINSWAPAGSMATPRGNHTATLLPNGKVLVAGGYFTNYQATPSAELYDPATNSWAPAGSMASARGHHTATLLSDGKVLVVGGYSADNNAPLTAELYDPATNSWSSAGFMATWRDRHTATQLPDGKVLVAGGGSNSAELYDPATNTWSSGGSMATVRYESTATLLANGLVLVAGGHNGPTHSTAELYDPATNSWLWAGSMAVARESHTATVLPDGKVLVAGGRNFTIPPTFYTNAGAELYDPATNSWSSVGSMTNERYYHTATLLPNNKVLVTGGATNSIVLASVELYVPGGPGGVTTPMTTATPPGGVYNAPQTVVLTSNVPATIYYTLDGSTPSTGSTVYYGPLFIHSTTTLRFFARNGVGMEETVQTAVYTIQDTTPPTTTAFPSGGTYSSPINVSLSASESATIFYTLNGADPTTASPVYTGPISISGSTVLKFLARDSAGNMENVKAESYTITPGSGGTPWSFAGSMLNARTGHTATLLPNGKLLVAGGENADANAELYDPATNSWSAAGSMATARAWHTATLLPNGKVLVAGGRGLSSYSLSSAELYDPSTNSWSAAGSMVEERVAHTATLLRNGKVLLAGGLKVGSGYLSSAELYDPATNSWSQTGSLITARDYFTATLLSNGKVLAVGGGGPPNNLLSSAELYDPATGTWSAAGPMAIGRFDHTATLLANGKVLVAGGIVVTGSRASVELYDPATDSWSAGAPMTTARESHNATLLPNGKLLVNGGVDESLHSLTSAELYDPAANSWSTAGSLVTGRYLSTSTLLPDGRVLVAGGYDFSASRHVSTTELYNPAASSWSSAGYMTNEREGHTATLLPNGKVLLAGGWGNNGPPAGAELYDPSTNSWSAAGSLAIPRYEHTATLLRNGKVLIAGGLNSSGPLASVEIYDPVTNSWSPAGSMSTARHLHTATLLASGKVLVAGATGANSSRSAELYDPATNSWSAAGSMATGRYYHTATMLTDGRVLVTAGRDSGYNVLSSAELYDPASNSWSTAGNLAAAREWHAAVLLPNGRILVTGGFNSSGALASADLYDPASNSWSIAASMANARSSHAATLLGSGDVLVSGGNSSEELYHPATNSWSAAGAMATARSIHTATLLPTGKVLVTGGIGSPFYLYSAELYDQGLGFPDSRRPVISGMSKVPGNLLITGHGFMGDSGGSAGTANNSSTGYPLVQLRRIDNGAQTFVSTDPVTTWSGDSISINDGALSGLADGPYMVTVYASGVPSLASYLELTIRLDQGIGFDALPARSYGDASFALDATATSGLPVTFTSSNPAVATVSGNTVTIVGVGNTIITASQEGNASYSAATPVSRQLTVNKATATLTLGDLTATYDGTPKAATAVTNPAGLPFSLTYDGAVAPPAAGGSYTVVGTIDDANFQGSSSATLVINRAATSIILNGITPVSSTYGEQVTMTATVTPATAGGKVQFGNGQGWSQQVDVVNGTAQLTTATMPAGVNTITAQYQGDGNYLPATSAAMIQPVNRGAQTITFPPLANKTIIDAPFAPGATASSGLPIAYTSSNPAVATVSGDTITITGLGTTTIIAGQWGDGNYNAASTAAQTLTVTKATAAIAFGNLTVTYDGTPKPVTATTDPAGLGLTITYNGSATAPTEAGSYPVVATIGDASYEGSASATLTIDKAGQTIACNELPARTYGDAAFALNCTASSGLEVHLASSNPAVATVSGNMVTIVGAGAATIIASQEGNGNYSAAIPLSPSLTVNKAAATMTLGNLTATYDGSAKAATATTSPAGLTVAFTYNDSAVAPVAAGSYSVVGTINDANYQGSATGTLTIVKAATTVSITGATPNPSTHGQAVTVTATVIPAGGSGKVQFSNGQGWVQLVDVNAGGTATMTSSTLPAGGNAITAQYQGDNNHNQSPLSAPFTQIVSRTNQSITFAPLPTKVLGDPDFTLGAIATSGLAVSYISTNPAVATVSGNTVTIVGPGSTTIIASQWGDSDYNAAGAVSQSLTVISAQQGIKVNDGGSDSYFTTITAAYNGITSGSNVTMQLPNVTLTDQLVFDKNYQLTLMGGYDPLLGSYTGVTTIQGSVTIQGGTVIFDGSVVIM